MVNHPNRNKATLPVSITIAGQAMTGKSMIAQRISELLKNAGMDVHIIDQDLDQHELFKRRPDSILAGRQVKIEVVQVPRMLVPRG